MKNIFTKYISIESILVEIDSLNLSVDQRHHLVNLIDSSLHHAIMDAILSNLTSLDKKIFLHHLQYDKDEEVMDFLNKRIDNIEEKIKVASDELVGQLHKDVREAKRL